MEKSKIKKEIFEWIKVFLIAGVIALIIVQFIAPTIVRERSMEPSFYGDDYLLISKRSYSFSEPKRGDVIVFQSKIPLDIANPDRGNKLLIKRIIGLPGDRIDILDGEVFINNRKAVESYIKDGFTNGDVSNFVVPEGQYYCMGDNRQVSVDSRNEHVGCVPHSDIVGKVFVRLYPFNSFGLIENLDPLGEK